MDGRIVETVPLRGISEAVQSRACYSSKDGYYVLPAYLVVRQIGMETQVLNVLLTDSAAEKEARRLAEVHGRTRGE